MVLLFFQKTGVTFSPPWSHSDLSYKNLNSKHLTAATLRLHSSAVRDVALGLPLARASSTHWLLLLEMYRNNRRGNFQADIINIYDSTLVMSSLSDLEESIRINPFSGQWNGQRNVDSIFDSEEEYEDDISDIDLATPTNRDRPPPYIVSPFYHPFDRRMPAERRPATAKHWCFTWNNYPNNAVETLTAAFEGFNGAQAWCFQHEIGTHDTPHIQGCIKFTRRVRWSQLELPDAIHWEACRGSWQENVNYCSKEASRDRARGPPISRNCYPTEVVTVLHVDELHPWQRKVFDICQGPVHNRHIYWLWETAGDVGKSSFVKMMVVNHQSLFCAGGKTTDIINLVYNSFTAHQPIKCVFIDLPRSAQGRVSFNAVEMLKNGLIANMKYETGIAAFNPPHIFIFSNHEPPNMDELSADRWRIYEIIDLDVDL